MLKDIGSLGLLNIGILASLFGGLLYSLKSVPKVIIRKIKQHYIFSVIIYDYDELFYVLENWLYRNHSTKYKSVEASYLDSPDNRNNYYASDDETENLGKSVIYKQDVNVFIIRWQGKRLVFSKTKEKIDSIKDTQKLYSYHYNISGYRAKTHIKGILDEITAEYNKSKEDNRVKIYTSVWGDWAFHSKRDVKSLENTILNEEDKKFLTEDIMSFEGKSSWYKDVNLFYKRTYLLYGPPGTGKTTLSFAIASQTGRSIYVLSLSSVASDETMIRLFSSLEKGSLLLIEDVDAAFVQRENKENKGVSFSCLLNCIDGAFSKDNVVTIMTTNHIEKLDPALLRPGRVDVKMEVPKATEREISEFLSLFYQTEVNINDKLSAPMSNIQEICIRNSSSLERAVTQIKKEYGKSSTKQIKQP